MTCQNSELRLEIGNGIYFPILGQPEIIDQLNAHGTTCSLQIKVGRNESLPAEGQLVFLTRLLNGVRTKLFGGICGQVNPDLGVAFDTVNLTLNNYLDYTKRKQIQNYRYTDILASHILRAGVLAGCYAVEGIPRQLLEIITNPDPDNNEPFLFTFDQGDFNSFLDQITSLRNCNYVLLDTGALSISSLGLYNAILRVNTNKKLVQAAPVSELRIPETGQSLCDVFWQAGTLSYSLIEPIASSILVLGKNGKNIPTSGITSIGLDTKRYIAVADQTQYETSKTADELIKVLVTIGMADPVEFTKVLFEDLPDPSNPIPADGSHQAVYRKEENLIYVSSVDVPADALVQIIHITRFIKAVAEDSAAIAYFKRVANNAGTGEKIHLEIREDITDQATAQALANSLKDVLCAFNFLVSFGCVKIQGWKAGEQFRAIHEARNISFLVTINSVKIKLRNGGRDYYSIDAGTIRIMSESDAQNKILETQANPIKAALPFAIAGLYTG
jgi:hypothetical protein